MPRRSAGLLMYRERDGRLEVLLVHPGGPLWASRDKWVIPKGELDAGEDELTAAQREFAEETGFSHGGPYVALGEITQKGGKVVVAWAFEGDCDPENVQSNTFTMEWPPKSGRRQSFPEVDRAAFFEIEEAKRKMRKTQVPLLDRLVEYRAHR